MIWRVSNCSYIQTPHISKRNLIVLLPPWLAPSLEPPACTPSLSLLLHSQSQAQWHPFTHPFMSHDQWVSGQRHTFQSDSCFSVSSGLDRGVCVSASVCVCYCFYSRVLWLAAEVLEIQRKKKESLSSSLFPLSFSLFFLRWVLSFWVLSFGFRLSGCTDFVSKRCTEQLE